MAYVFLSYARVDLELARRLELELSARGIEAWLDVDDLASGVPWRVEIRRAIEGADAFVCLLSPETFASQPCRDELARAKQAGKRIVPVVVRDVDPSAAPPDLIELNWLFMRGTDPWPSAVVALKTAVEADPEWTRAHTRILQRAEDWDRSGRDRSFLLREGELDGAQTWVARAIDTKVPRLTPIQLEFIKLSQEVQTAELRRIEGLYQSALSRQLAAQAALMRHGQPNQFDRSLLLAAESLRRQPNAEADSLLREMLGLAAFCNAQWEVGALLNQLATSARWGLVATATCDGTVTLWSATGEAIRRFSCEQDIRTVAFDKTQDRLAAGGASGRVWIWQVDGELVHSFEVGCWVNWLEFFSDGRLAVGGHGASVVHTYNRPIGK